jgi:hypothetical protein
MSACIGPLASEPSYLHLRPSAPMKVVGIMRREWGLFWKFIYQLLLVTSSLVRHKLIVF